MMWSKDAMATNTGIIHNVSNSPTDLMLMEHDSPSHSSLLEPWKLTVGVVDAVVSPIPAP